MVQLYSTGRSVKEVADALGAGVGAVRHWVITAGVGRNYQQAAVARSDGHPLQWGPLTPERAWLIGLIFGDGGIRRNGTEANLTIANEDEDVAYKVMAILRYWPKLQRRQGCAQLWISSRKFVAMLNTDFGLDHDKCATMQWPDIPCRLIPHFVRGLLDSDGCWHQRIGRQNRQLIFAYCSIAHNFVRSMESSIHNTGLVCPRTVCIKAKKIHFIDGRRVVSSPLAVLEYGHLDCVALGNWLYAGDTEHMRCERKYQYWLERSDAYVKPHWVLRHQRHRAKLLAQLP
jgi:hypothetical protein